MKSKKIIVYHQKPKKGTRKKQGHRQHYTRVLIDTIELKDKVLAKAEERKANQQVAKATKEAKKPVKAAAAPKTAAPKAKTAAKPASKAKK